MPRRGEKRLTRTLLRALEAESASEPSKRRMVTDSGAPGFAAVALGGRIRLVYRYRFDGRIREVALGEWSDDMKATKLDEHREQARAYRIGLKAGRDPVVVRAERAKADAATAAEAAGAPTVEQAVDQYLAHLEARHRRGEQGGGPRARRRRKGKGPIRASTLAATRGLLKWPRIEWGSRRLTEISEQDVTDLHAKIAEGRHRRGGRPAPIQGDKVVKALGGLLGWAKVPLSVSDVLDEHESSDLRERRSLNRREIRALGKVLRKAAAAESEHPSAILAVYLLALTGMRRSELLGFGEKARRDYNGLTWGDVDLAAGEITLRRAKSGGRVVLLGKAAVAVLVRARPANCRPEAFVCPGRIASQPFVGIDKVRIRLFGAAGIEAGDGKRVDLHSLRTTFGTRAAEVLGSELPAKALLGHKLGTGATALYLDALGMRERAREWIDAVDASLAADLGLDASGTLVPMRVRRPGP